MLAMIFVPAPWIYGISSRIKCSTPGFCSPTELSMPDGVSAIGEAAFRRTSGITELYIPTSVVSIGNYFIADSSVTAILYAGSEEAWGAIEKTDMWNFGNREVRVEYSAGLPTQTQEVLVVYFSNTGNTQQVAEYIAAAAGGVLWQIVPQVAYTDEDLDYTDSNCRARQEQNDENARPAIDGSVARFGEYDAVFIGHPIWWGGAPRIIQTFIESYDFSDKQVYTFSTSASSSGSGALSALEREYPEINFVGNIHFTGSTLSSAQERVNAWIIELGFSA